MRCQPTALSGLIEVLSDANHDERGSFRRTWCRDSFAAAGIDFAPSQASLSDNPLRHTLRGMHFQVAPVQEQKLVRCLSGQVFDIAVDLREGSPTHGQHVGVTLCAARGNALFIPRGFAHGFLTLTDGALLEYLIDVPHSPTHARGLRWDDPALALPWPAQPVLMSERDRSWPNHD